jgi:hypothetical protein
MNTVGLDAANSLEESRFRRVFTWIARSIVSARSIGGLLLVLAVLSAALWSPHIAFGFVACFMVLICLSIERRHLDHFLIPPLVLIAIQQLMSSGLGQPLIWLGMSYRYGGHGNLMPILLLTQAAHAVGFAAFVFGYWLPQRGAPALRLPLPERRKPEFGLRVLYYVGWMIWVYYAVWLIAGHLTGGTDRSRMAEFLNRGTTTWSLINIFPRLLFMYFVFVPLMHRLGGWRARFVLWLSTGYLFTTFLFSGSRGMLLTPTCLLIVGWWAFYPASRRVVTVFVLMGMLVLPYIPFIALYRSTDAFQNSREGDWLGRIAAFADVQQGLERWDVCGLLQLTGESLHGGNDRVVFELTPKEVPFAGWKDVGRLKYFWLPSQLAPWKKSLLDANEIVIDYLKDPTIFGAGISFTADMFRRFGWTAVVVGNLLLGVFIGSFARWAFVLAARGHLVWSTLLVIYIGSYLTSTPARTLLETAWIWFWELPKHLVLLLLFVMVARRLAGSYSNSGHAGPSRVKNHQVRITLK